MYNPFKRPHNQQFDSWVYLYLITAAAKKKKKKKKKYTDFNGKYVFNLCVLRI